MAHFLAAVRLTSTVGAAEALKSWATDVRDVYGISSSQTESHDGFDLVVMRDRDDDSGLETDASSIVAWVGILLDNTSRGGPPNILASTSPNTWFADSAQLNRFEGAFAAVAWDRDNQRLIAFNDQASMLSLYAIERHGRLWITTAALPLARALKLPLDPEGTCELFARGALLAPNSMFSELRRLSIGEHLTVERGRVEWSTHWSPYKDIASGATLVQSSERLAEVIRERLACLARGREPVAADLSGGLDSRLVVAGLHAAEVRFDVMTYGLPDSPDVLISQNISRAMGWSSRYFRPEEFAGVEMTDSYRRELLWRTGGELPFSAIFHGSLFRRELASGHCLHVSGSTGELTRYFPWAQEFLGIGRRRPANVGNALRYRFLQEGMPPVGMFADDWIGPFSARLGQRIRAVCASEPSTSTTQQMDAVYLWKMTSHASLYVSSTFGFLPNVAPMGLAGILDVNLSIPWWLKLTTRLNRLTNHRLSPQVAAFPTCYGGTGAPPSLRTLHLEAGQIATQVKHFVRKVERIALRGVVSRRIGSTPQPSLRSRRPYLTAEFRRMMDPSTMYSSALYNAEFLKSFLTGTDEDLSAREPFLSRIATVEQLCREIGFQPSPGFLLRGKLLV